MSRSSLNQKGKASLARRGIAEKREGGIEYHKRLRTLWIAQDAGSEGACGEPERERPKSQTGSDVEGLWVWLRTLDCIFGHLYLSAQLRAVGQEVFVELGWTSFSLCILVPLPHHLLPSEPKRSYLKKGYPSRGTDILFLQSHVEYSRHRAGSILLLQRGTWRLTWQNTCWRLHGKRQKNEDLNSPLLLPHLRSFQYSNPCLSHAELL